ncbi:hypothetical protein J3B02_005775 [Coemansia erecta]|nr:hypothetical protein J3B02_005775 [Coemansia erecta]
MILVSRKTQQPVTIEEAQRLARLVRKYGRRWSYIHRTHFPDRNPDELTYMFKQWERLGKRYNVDLLDVDPFSMISDFDGERAMRPTGPDGNYHPNGPLSQVFKSGHASFLTPYTLALSNIYMRKGSVKIIRALSLAGDSDSMSPLPAKSIDKLIAAIGRHQNDWISISKEVGTSIKQCRQYALILASSITSIRNIISDPDMDSLAQERGWKDMQQKQKQKKKQVE